MKRPLLPILCLTLGPVLILMPGAAAVAAPPTSIAVLPIEQQELEAEAARVHEALRAAVESFPEYVEKGPVEMNVEEARMSFSCFDEAPDCMSQVGEVLEVGLVLWGKLQRDASSWTLRLKLLDVGKQTLVRDQTVRIAKGSDAVGRLEALAADFVKGEPLDVPPLTPLQVRSKPAGAEIRLDGEVVGVTPAEVLAEPGAFMIELRHPAHDPVRRAISVTREPATIDIALVPPVEPPPAAPPPPVAAAEDRAEPSRVGLWTGIATGAVAVAAAGAWVYYGLETLDLADQADGATAAGQAPLKEDFDDVKLLANVALGVTVVATAASVYFLVFHDDGGNTVAVTPTVGGVSLGGTF